MAADGEDSAGEEHPPTLDEEGGAGGITEVVGAGDGGFPSHMGSTKQLHSGNGYNLAVSPEGHIYGTRELYHGNAALEFRSDAPGEVRIRGIVAQLYVAMNDRGKVYAEDDSTSENIIWVERYDSGYNNYVWKKGLPDKEWFLGLKKSGRPKRGEKTRPGQKAIRFLPRAVSPKND